MSRSGHLGLPVGLDDGVDEGNAVGGNEVVGEADGCDVGLYDEDAEGCELGLYVGAVVMVGLELGGNDGEYDGGREEGDCFVMKTSSVALLDWPLVSWEVVVKSEFVALLGRPVALYEDGSSDELCIGFSSVPSSSK